MAYPNVKLNASTGNDAYSGAGPGDGVTAGSVITGTTASVATTNAYIGLYDTVDLSAVATDGSHTIQLNYTTAGKQSLLALNGKKTTTASGEVTVDGDGITCHVTSGDNVHAGAYPIKIGSDYRYIASGGGESPDFTIDVAVTAGTGIAFSEPMAVSVAIATLTNLAAGQYSFAVGGKKGSFWGPLFLASALSNTVVGQFGGWIFDVEANQTVNQSSINWSLTASSTSGLAIVIRGRSESDPTVFTFSGSANVLVASSDTARGVIFKDFNLISNTASLRWNWYSVNCINVNVKWLRGTGAWDVISGGNGTYYGCTITTNVGLAQGTYTSCTIIHGGSNITTSYTAIRLIKCIIIGKSTRSILNLYGDCILIDCDLIDVIGSPHTDYTKVYFANTSFSFTSSYSDYAIQFLAPSTGWKSFAYGNFIVGCNYYNCLGLFDPATCTGLDRVSSVITNINPAYTDIANGDPTNTALQSQGYPAKHVGTSVNTNYPIGSYVAAPGAGGSTVYVPIPTEDE